MSALASIDPELGMSELSSQVSGTTAPLTQSGVLVATVARKLLPNCSAVKTTMLAI